MSPAELAYDRLLENDGKRMFYFPVFGYQTHDLSRQLAMLQDPSAILSLSDAGAHCGVLCDASLPSSMLAHWVGHQHHRFRHAAPAHPRGGL